MSKTIGAAAPLKSCGDEENTSGNCDVAIIGAGPIGLALARALSAADFSVTLLERQRRPALEQPAPDGREIALTRRAVDILKSLGIWGRIPAGEIAEIRKARVLNGSSPSFLSFDTRESGSSSLGVLVPNHQIRRAAFSEAITQEKVVLLDGVRVERVEVSAEAATVFFADGHTLRARLVVAADSRLSETRRQMGIGAEMEDFGRDVIVCHLEAAEPHNGIAYECFGNDRTLAMLPLNGNRLSAVVTAPSNIAAELMRLSDADYARQLSLQFGKRLGRLSLVGNRHSYPLLAVYADCFVGQRFALAGDAAVGMHPVTAHGFNLGLYGVETLGRLLAIARRGGRDIGDAAALSCYDAEHRRATRPMYLATNTLVRLFTDNRLPARALRTAVIRIADRMTPLKAAITRQLTRAR